jgi:hypothetical protein
MTVLMLSTLFHTHAISADATSTRFAGIRILLDDSTLEAFPSGFVPVCVFAPSFRTGLKRYLQVDTPGEPPVVVSAPHAHLLLLIMCEVSVAKRGVSERNPKLRVLAGGLHM